MTASFDGKVAIVTGGGAGMGRATSVAFAAAGASVVVADVDEDGGNETVSLVEKAGGKAAFIRTDVGDETAVQAMVRLAVDRFGGIDCAMNGAAIEGETGRLAECDVEEFDRMMRVNLRSIFLCMKYEILAIQEGGRRGAIVNIASTNAFRPQPSHSIYTATKHGVLGMTRNAAFDYARDGIRINAICPGAIDTAMLRGAMAQRGRDPDEVAGRLSPMARFGEPSEIAAAVLWLCSDESSFTVGHALAVDGGYLAS